VAVFIACLAPRAFAATLTTTPRGIVVAHDGVIELFQRNGKQRIWRVDGVKTVGVIATSNDRVAVLDPLADEIRVVELATGRATTLRTGETPIGAMFIGRELYVLERDARALERIGADGTRASVSTGADPAFLRERDGVLYVYARSAGLLQEIGTNPLELRRSATVPAFGSDLEVDGRNAYIVQPRAGKIAVVERATMKQSGAIDAGAVPVDMTFASGGTALTARTLAVADPSAKKVWMIEASQSVGEAFLRGFFREFLGLGLFGGRSSQFPTGVDHVVALGSRWYAYDSSSRTLYRFTKSRSSIAAKNVDTKGFAVAPDGLFVWDEAVRRLQKTDLDE